MNTLFADFDPTSVPPDQIPILLSQLGALQVRLAARLMASPPSLAGPEQPTDDRLLTTAEAAAALRKSVKWLYRHKNYPFVRQLPGGGLLFSQRGIERWLAKQRA
jgi:hypothetical protein